MSKTIGDQSADGPGSGSDHTHAVSLNLPKWFCPKMELKPPQPFKKSVIRSPNTENSRGVLLYATQNFMAGVAGVVTQVIVFDRFVCSELGSSPQYPR